MELKAAPDIEVDESSQPSTDARRLTIRGRGETQVGGLDRVLAVVSYATPEMDYFSPQARPFLEELVRRYHAAGVPLNGLYADEMHIQQDWGYGSHHDEGQLTFRYLTPHLAARYAELYGAEFKDFEKYLVYFAYAQHGFLPTLEARAPAQHVLGRQRRRKCSGPSSCGGATTSCSRKAWWSCLPAPSSSRRRPTGTSWRPARTRPGRRAPRATSGAPAPSAGRRAITNTRRTSGGPTPSTRPRPPATITSPGTTSSPAAATTMPRADGRTATTTASPWPARPAS